MECGVISFRLEYPTVSSSPDLPRYPSDRSSGRKRTNPALAVIRHEIYGRRNGMTQHGQCKRQVSSRMWRPVMVALLLLCHDNYLCHETYITQKYDE